MPDELQREVRSSAAGRTRPVHGVSLGMLVLDTRFERLPGDVANALTWDFPIQFKVVTGASAERVVAGGARDLLPPFVDAARDLVRLGVDGIVTSCGFLSVFQSELAAAVEVPVATSSLLQVPWVQALLPPGRRVGVLTFDAGSLTPRHLAAVGVPADTPIADVPPGSAFRRVHLGGAGASPEALAADVIAAAERLVRRHPEVGAIVAECTNMPPHSAAVSRHLGMPVFDAVTMIRWFHAGLRPRRFVGE